MFQHIFDIHLSIYPIYQQACECPMQNNDWSSKQLSSQFISSQQHFLNSEQNSYTKHVCLSSKTIVTTDWTHLE